MVVLRREDKPALIPSDNELLSLCARYPEITFDVEMEKKPRGDTDQLQSSPLSTTDKDDGELTRLSDSTAHTTPLRGRGSLANVQPAKDALPGFLHLVRNNDLDDDCSQVFVRLGYTIDILGEAIRSLDLSVNSQSSIDGVLSLCQSLLSPASEVLGRIENYIQNVSRLKSFVAFNTQPTEDRLWSAYRQRAQLIIRHLALPSKSESQLTSALANLFNRQVYRPFLNVFDTEESNIAPVTRALNQLYDVMMTWQEKYQCWCIHMRDLRHRYMLPLLKQIHATPEVLQEIRDLHAAKTAAKEVLVRPGAPGTMPLDESTIRALISTAERRRAPGRRVKSKLARGHTV